jgi:hypothetical protein
MDLIQLANDVLAHSRAGKYISVCCWLSGEGWFVWGPSEGNHFSFIVLEHNRDNGVCLIINLILDNVLTIVLVGDSNWDVLLATDLLSISIKLHLLGDFHDEVVSTRFSVLTQVISGLNNELNWGADAAVLEKSSSISEWLVSSSVHEVSEVSEGSGEVTSLDRQLNNALFGSE